MWNDKGSHSSHTLWYRCIMQHVDYVDYSDYLRPSRQAYLTLAIQNNLATGTLLVKSDCKQSPRYMLQNGLCGQIVFVIGNGTPRYMHTKKGDLMPVLEYIVIIHASVEPGKKIDAHHKRYLFMRVATLNLYKFTRQSSNKSKLHEKKFHHLSWRCYGSTRFDFPLFTQIWPHGP